LRRVAPDGKHLSVSGDLFRVRGVTYGSFAPRLDGYPFPDPTQIKRDLMDMARVGLNTVRTYAPPPDDLLEMAEELELRVIAGIHFEDWRYEAEPGRRARRRVREAGRRGVAEAMARLGGRSVILAVAVGNEVPGDIVRVHGIGAVEESLSELVADVHAADPGMPATYVSFPTTEYLEVEGQDLACFNVFLEERDKLRAYLRRLQVRARDVPLILTELGLAEAIHGPDAQAESLSWQLEEVDRAGLAGATVFSWTDEWSVDGKPVEGWGFGITDAERRPKPALEVVSRWAGSATRDLSGRWPSVSVVVCAYNEERHLEDCLDSLERCAYPDLEVIVCDDGSTDRTLEIARRYPFRVLELPHSGLSAARNAGTHAATGEVVAFLDADAACHPEWPYHLALSLEEENVMATGGPNLPDPAAGLVERAVAASPGGPVEVLVSDDRAEHVPGCNMAYRKEALEAVGGFDPVFTSAGDDVDVCWKLLDRGWEIAFAPAAQVHHHRRDSVRGYLRQQRGYGRSERMVAARHPWRYNRLGQARWKGFIYGGLRAPRWLRPVVYHGPAGTAPYQGVVRHRWEPLLGWIGALLPLAAPVALLGALAPLSLWWLVAPAVAAASVAAYGTAASVTARPARDEPRPIRFRLLVGMLHAAQPFVRAWGRLTGPRARRARPRSPEWTGDRVAWLGVLRRELEARGWQVRVPGAHEAWDLEAVRGPLWRARINVAVVWGWEPLSRTSLSPRAPLLVGVATPVALAALAPAPAAIAFAGIALLGAADAARVKLAVRRARKASEGDRARSEEASR
jgi:glycosyltransferase involved in cell wall biosynthesis